MMADSYRPPRTRARVAAAGGIDRYEPPPPPPPPYGGYTAGLGGPAPPAPRATGPSKLSRPPEFMHRDHYAPPPPPPFPYDDYDHRGGGRDYRPPPPPLPPGRPPPMPMRYFGSDHDRRDAFDFAPPPNSYPRYPGGQDNYRPPTYDERPARRRFERGDRQRREGGRDRAGHDRRRDGRNNRPFKKPGASERALLRFDRGETPPQLEGMNGGAGGAKYLDFDDLSDVEEQDMDESDEDNSGEEKEPTPPPKPKWSNAELYTALPPPDETQHRKKDMVKLIRKARIQQTDQEREAKKPVPIDDDFIALDFGDDDDDDEVEEEQEEEFIRPGAAQAQSTPAQGMQVESAPSIPATDKPNGQHAQDVPMEQSVASRLPTLKRKRVIEDDDDELLTGHIRAPTKSLKRGAKPTGVLLDEWTLNSIPPAVRAKRALPWQTKSAAHEFALPKVRLHHELVDFYHFVQPKSYEEAVRRDLLQRLETFMKRVEPTLDPEVKIFGSFALGVYLPDADMDVTVHSKDFRTRGVRALCQSSSKMFRLGNRFKNEGFADAVEIIPKARVPIIKIIDRQTGLKMDISFEQSSGVTAIQTFERWKAQFPVLPILITIVKQFLLMRGLNDVAIGGLGGFAVTCLVTSLLQHLPRVQSGETIPEEHLGEILIEFLDYYGSRFDRYNTAIQMEPPALIPKQPIIRGGLFGKSKPDRLMIIDPNNESNDISGGTADISLVFHKFRQAKAEILKAIEMAQSRARPSLIDWMLGGNYDSFLWYRRKLKEVYEKKFGAVPPEDPTVP